MICDISIWYSHECMQNWSNINWQVLQKWSNWLYLSSVTFFHLRGPLGHSLPAKVPKFWSRQLGSRGINSKRILNGFWGWLQGGGGGWEVLWIQGAFFNSHVFFWFAVLRGMFETWDGTLTCVQGCPRATCERCRWCCITTHTYPDNPLPLAPRCWKFCPVSIITHNDTLNNAYLFHNVDPVSIRMKPFMCHNMFHRLHPMHPRFTLSRVWHQPGSTTQQPSTFKNPLLSFSKDQAKILEEKLY